MDAASPDPRSLLSPLPSQVESEADFDSCLASAGTKLVMVDFYGSWCRPCKGLKPKFVDLATANPGAVFLTVNVGDHTDIAMRCDVPNVPAFKFFRCVTCVRLPFPTLPHAVCTCVCVVYVYLWLFVLCAFALSCASAAASSRLVVVVVCACVGVGVLFVHACVCL